MSGERVSLGSDGSSSEEGERNPKHRRTYKEAAHAAEKVVSSAERAGRSPRARRSLEDGGRVVEEHHPRGEVTRPSPARSGTEAETFSKDEVVKLLADQRRKLLPRSEVGNEGEWKLSLARVRRLKKEAAADTREEAERIVSEVARNHRTPCWDCRQRDHLSRDCPLGITCLACKGVGHKAADCHLSRRRARHEERGPRSENGDKRKRRPGRRPDRWVLSESATVTEVAKESVEEGEVAPPLERDPAKSKGSATSELAARGPDRWLMEG